MKYETPEEFITYLHEKEDEGAGKNGIVEFRKVVKKCSLAYYQYGARFNQKNDNSPGEKWLHRKGIKKSDLMTKEKERWDAGFETIKTPYKYERGYYSELIRSCTNNIPVKLYHKWTNTFDDALKCISDIENQGFDEHGGWESGGEFDKHGRGTAISTDIYGIDIGRNLYVIQVREYSKRYKNGYSNIKKNYFLIGYNENGNPFAHPIPSTVVHGAIKKDRSIKSPVKAAQAWIWGIKQEKLNTVLRNGDVAMVPVKVVPRKDVIISKGMERIVDSHFIYSKEIRKNGSIYALNPTIRHMKRQHPTIMGKGWFKVIVGNRANYHEFAAPTAD